MNKKNICFIIGIAVLLIIIVSYFIPITFQRDYGNGVSANVQGKLLSVLIFYNPYILSLYIIIGIVLIVYGFYPDSGKRR